MPRPVHPKSQMQRKAMANPSTDGTTATHRQRAVPATSALNPSHCGSSQNHKEKNAPPTISEATAVGHRAPRATVGILPDSSVTGPLSVLKGSSQFRSATDYAETLCLIGRAAIVAYANAEGLNSLVTAAALQLDGGFEVESAN